MNNDVLLTEKKTNIYHTTMETNVPILHSSSRNNFLSQLYMQISKGFVWPYCVSIFYAKMAKMILFLYENLQSKDISIRQ